MGLSRNKVAVSEGAAGSPPFYGEQADFHGSVGTGYGDLRSEMYGTFVVQFSGIRGMVIGKRKAESPERWGCSSAGRAPALQAGGHGFDSHHLHQNQGFGACAGSVILSEHETIGATPIPMELGMCAKEAVRELAEQGAHLGSDSHHEPAELMEKDRETK